VVAARGSFPSPSCLFSVPPSNAALKVSFFSPLFVALKLARADPA